MSNTFFLEQMGWSGLLIEPIASLCEQASRARPRSRVVHAACGPRASRETAKFTVAHNVPFLSYLRADPQHVEPCKREGAQLVETEVPLRTLNDILLAERTQAPASASPWLPNVGWRIDLASIDTEGSELDVLDGFSLERLMPRVLIIENDRPAGASIEPYLSTRGYRKFHRLKINDFYVREVASGHDLTLSDLFPGAS